MLGSAFKQQYATPFVILLTLFVIGCANSSRPTEKGDVLFTGGYETDSRDGGRPVNLIAAALDVAPQVFRDAFSGVTPAKGGGPTHSQAQANKKVLMDALGKHGVTNERLDEVSNYYRYRPESGELWQHTPATAKAIIKDGKITGIEITDPGSGYLSTPSVKLIGYEDIELEIELEFGTDLNQNVKVSSIRIVEQ